MAATDQTYRPQKTLDVIFGATCVILLVTTVWMFWEDYNRPFKKVQRQFRDVEEAMAQRQIVALAPTPEQMTAVEAAQKAVLDARMNLDKVKAEHRRKVDDLNVKRVKADNKARDIKAEYDSKMSFYVIAIDERNAEDPASSRWKDLNKEVEGFEREVRELFGKLERARNELEELNWQLKEATDAQSKAEDDVARTEKSLKDLTDEFDRFHKLAAQKRWGFGDWLRTLPVIDAFNSPLRIDQFTLEELPIDYSFKRVTRYDRCKTCHQGIDKPSTYVNGKWTIGYERETLAALVQPPSEEQKNRLELARQLLQKRKDLGADVSPSGLALNQVNLSPSQVTQFCVHPRMDLFVDVNSPHPQEKFGCTICHSGQGSATDFYNAVHSPNTTAQRDQWQKTLGWEHIHFWDSPMLPKRFVESSCVKCHYEMTGLIRDGSRNEAPKLLRGYNLIKDNGCFGCHEIAGIKGGRWVGPDLRLEPNPALDELTPLERARAQSDPLNPPGTMRKVGPNLRRLSEKTNEDWARKWLHSPRGFRPDTKMPHFYGLANNTRDALPEGQKDFPDAEIHSVVHYLFRRSEVYLNNVTERHKDGPEARRNDQQLFDRLTALANPSPEEKKQLEEVRKRIGWRNAALPVANFPLPPEPKGEKEREKQLRNGRQLFSERGCLACHSHDAVTKPGLGLPAISGDAEFGPDLTRIADKLGTGKPGDESARKWLVHWIMDPTTHHPRSFMPVTHLNREEANDVATWLLSTRTGWTGAAVPAPSLLVLKQLARVHLEKAVPLKRQLDEMLPVDQDREGVTKGFTPDQLKGFRVDAEEQELTEPLNADKLKMYIGRKAIGQLGCYACHYVPGFHDAKPIGTPLNDWGLKRPERLAFEDAVAYVQKTYHVVPERNDAKDPGKPASTWAVDKDGKLPYEKYFFEALEHHFREGFLHQKLSEPRSYDYARIKAWDERLRMPQFRFSRKVPGPNATPEEVAAIELEEAEAREAVMTFILGLVAEPIPPKFVYTPPPERQAEIKGRAVLDKFNCAGCHMVRPGVYDFKTTPAVITNLIGARDASVNASDHPFLDHAAWTGQNPKIPGRLTAFGNPPSVFDEESKSYVIRLTQALRFQAGTPPVPVDIPAAGASILLPQADLIKQPDGQFYANPYGGNFGNLLIPYLRKLDPNRFRDDEYARLGGPPALLFEGEKTQGEWLYQFLRNPVKVREYTVLRMPKFSLSDEEARALVNYFAAVDKVSNPGAGLQAPFFSVPEREDSYLRAQNASYLERLKQDQSTDKKYKNAYEQRLAELEPIWDRLLRVQLTEVELRSKDVEFRASAAQGEDKKTLVAEHEALGKEIVSLRADVEKKDYARFKKAWEAKNAYLIDGYKLVANNGICLNCHQVGNLQPKDRLAPSLNISWERLRPDWLEKWIANPERFMNYKTQMPQNFPGSFDNVLTQHSQFMPGLPVQEVLKARADFIEAKKKGDAKAMAALNQKLLDLQRQYSRNQVIAVRDVLVNLPQVLEIPENRHGPVPTAAAGGGK